MCRGGLWSQGSGRARHASPCWFQQNHLGIPPPSCTDGIALILKKGKKRVGCAYLGAERVPKDTVAQRGNFVSEALSSLSLSVRICEMGDRRSEARKPHIRLQGKAQASKRMPQASRQSHSYRPSRE